MYRGFEDFLARQPRLGGADDGAFIRTATPVFPRMSLRTSRRLQLTTHVIASVSVIVIAFLIVKCCFLASSGSALLRGVTERTLATAEQPLVEGGKCEAFIGRLLKGLSQRKGLQEAGVHSSEATQKDERSQTGGKLDAGDSLQFPRCGNAVVHCISIPERRIFREWIGSFDRLCGLAMKELTLSSKDAELLTDEERSEIKQAKKMLKEIVNDQKRLHHLFQCSLILYEESEGSGCFSAQEPKFILSTESHYRHLQMEDVVYRNLSKVRSGHPHLAHTVSIMAKKRAEGRIISYAGAAALSRAKRILYATEVPSPTTSEEEVEIVRIICGTVDRVARSSTSMRDLFQECIAIGPDPPLPWRTAAKGKIAEANVLAREAFSLARGARGLSLEKTSEKFIGELEAAYGELDSAIFRTSMQMALLEPVVEETRWDAFVHQISRLFHCLAFQPPETDLQPLTAEDATL